MEWGRTRERVRVFRREQRERESYGEKERTKQRGIGEEQAGYSEGETLLRTRRNT